MSAITFNGEDYEADSIAVGPDFITGYQNGQRVFSFKGITDFSQYTIPDDFLDSYKQSAVAQTRQWLSDVLDKPMAYNGSEYTVTAEKQNLLICVIAILILISMNVNNKPNK